MDPSPAFDGDRNGGFPEPPPGEPVRVISARHPGCGASTRVRLPATVPARAVRRLRCGRCKRAFEAEQVRELKPARRWLDPQGRLWQVAVVPVAALLAIAGLALVRELAGGSPSAPPAPIEVALADTTTTIREPTFELALPAGWERVEAGRGAGFAAVSGDGDAEARLWVERHPDLDLPSFVTRSLAQLESLAGSARVVERVAAPTPEDSVVVLAADSPPGEPTYEVTLRAAGPYRYYLASSVEPGAAPATAEAAASIGDSLRPRLP